MGKVLWKNLSFLDGDVFTIFNDYYCKSSNQTELSMENALSICKEDTNCAMVSTLECTKEDSIYGLCNRSTELIPKLEACTLWKIGNKTTSEIPKRVNIFNLGDHRFKTWFLQKFYSPTLPWWTKKWRRDRCRLRR